MRRIVAGPQKRSTRRADVPRHAHGRVYIKRQHHGKRQTCINPEPLCGPLFGASGHAAYRMLPRFVRLEELEGALLVAGPQELGGSPRHELRHQGDVQLLPERLDQLRQLAGQVVFLQLVSWDAMGDGVRPQQHILVA